jgi:hypothetical protein
MPRHPLDKWYVKRPILPDALQNKVTARFLLETDSCLSDFGEVLQAYPRRMSTVLAFARDDDLQINNLYSRSISG